jgi:hypothetical protein
MKQYEAVELALERLGGIATLGQLNHEVFTISDCEWKTKTPFASIRRIVQQDDKIQKIKPGLYALKDASKNILIETEKNADSTEIQEFNHAYYQGLLLTIGKLHKLNTFVPQQDKNKVCGSETLGQIRTMQSLPDFTYPKLVHRSSTIDVIWFNERKMPDSFFEVEHTTDIQNSLLKFCDLQDFSVKMIIVADERRKEEFSKKMNYSAFKDLADKKRVNFLSYNQLENLYSQELNKQKIDFVL